MSWACGTKSASPPAHVVSMVMDTPSDQVQRGSNLRACDRGQARLERDFGLRIERDGTWTYLGSPIRRLALVKLFATVLRREADGSYWLVTPVERGRIEVEDAPFVAVELKVEGEGQGQRLQLRTNLDVWVPVGADHPLRLRTPPWADRQAQAPVPYVEVRAGLEARLLRPVFYELVELGREEKLAGGQRFGVWSAGQFFALDEGLAAE
jgi:uncharacterized protein